MMADMTDKQKIQILTEKLILLENVVLVIREQLAVHSHPDLSIDMDLLGQKWQEEENKLLMKFNLPVVHTI